MLERQIFGGFEFEGTSGHKYLRCLRLLYEGMQKKRNTHLQGVHAFVDVENAQDAVLSRECPHQLFLVEGSALSNEKRWYDYLYIFSALYLFLGLFHILFAWFDSSAL